MIVHPRSGETVPFLFINSIRIYCLRQMNIGLQCFSIKII
jgi:hypothetical protein